MELCRQESHSSELHTWVLPILGMMLGSVWPLVRPVDVRALPVCVLRRTPGGRITVGPGMGWRVISKIPESPGAVSSTPTATNTTFIQTEQVEEQKVRAMLLKTKTQSYHHSLGGDQSAAFHFEHVETLKICIYCQMAEKKIYKVVLETFKSNLPLKICFPVRVPSQRQERWDVNKPIPKYALKLNTRLWCRTETVPYLEKC